jgi:hypothetical protein
MSEPSHALVVTDELAARVRAVAEQHEMSAEDALAWLLGLILDAVERPLERSAQWVLCLVQTDDGPTPPVGFDKVIGDFPRWTTRIVPLRRSDDDAALPEEGVEDAVSAEEPRCDLCLLRRDDGVEVLVEVLTMSGEVLIHAMRNHQHQKQNLPLACHEVWIDFGSRVWRRMLATADELADQLVASDEGETDTPPESSPSS